MAIHDIVVEQMARAARLHAVAQGQDPRRLRIVAFGGAGPVHAAALGRRLGAPEVLVMPGAGVGAAVGLGLAPAVCVVARSRLCPVAEVDWPGAESLIAEMHAEALRDMGLPEAAAVEAAVSVDMRYRGQGYEVNVPFRGPPFSPKSGEALDAAFAAAYREHYGRENPGAAAEVVSWRLELRSGTLKAPHAPDADPATIPEEGRPTPDHRPVRFDDRYVDTPVWRRESLLPEESHPGPALVVERQTTTVVTPGGRFGIDGFGNLRIDLDGDGR